MAVHLASTVGLCYLLMRFFFPHVFLLPVVIAVGVLAFGCCVAPLRVALDRSAGEVAIAFLWTNHVPLARVKSVTELPLGVEIKTAGLGYEFGGTGWYFRVLKRLLRIRTGFEGMQQAVANVRAASSGQAEPEGAACEHGILGACLICGAALFALAAAVAVQPQADVWLVHALAWLLRIYFFAGGFVVMLVGAWCLYGALRDR